MYTWLVTMATPPANSWPNGAYIQLADIRTIRADLAEVEDGHLILTDPAGQIVFAAAPGSWQSCFLDDTKPTELPSPELDLLLTTGAVVEP